MAAGCVWRGLRVQFLGLDPPILQGPAYGHSGHKYYYSLHCPTQQSPVTPATAVLIHRDPTAFLLDLHSVPLRRAVAAGFRSSDPGCSYHLSPLSGFHVPFLHPRPSFQGHEVPADVPLGLWSGHLLPCGLVDLALVRQIFTHPLPAARPRWPTCPLCPQH